MKMGDTTEYSCRANSRGSLEDMQGNWFVYCDQQTMTEELSRLFTLSVLYF